MPLETLSAVRAVHDIARGRTVVVQDGAPGRIVDQHPGWGTTSYTVEFQPAPGGSVTIIGLTEGDVQPR